MQFDDLGLSAPILAALVAEGYQSPTPIQMQAIPPALAGRDVMGCAQTGTGKTAAFALPLLERLDGNRRAAEPRRPRVLVLSPTRELAAQIAESFSTYGRNLRFRLALAFGGVSSGPQVRAMNRGVHVLVATPGRLLDLMSQGFVRLDRLEAFVLDEADRMLDMGFLPDLRRIIAELPAERQSLFFSATMPESITRLADGLLNNPVRVQAAPPATTTTLVEQSVLTVDRGDKAALLSHLLVKPAFERTLVFSRTKHGADKIVRHLERQNIAADAIHGNKSQRAREQALLRFRTGKVKVLVATDLAARGIDVDGVSHVINYDLPIDPDSYVHRIGRTGRAGARGAALSFCDASERGALRAIERHVRGAIRVDADHPWHAPSALQRGGGHRPPAKSRGGQADRPAAAGAKPKKRRQNRRKFGRPKKALATA